MRKLLYLSMLLLVGCETTEKPKTDVNQYNTQDANEAHLPNDPALDQFPD